jgi:hypothetical protein
MNNSIHTTGNTSIQEFSANARMVPMANGQINQQIKELKKQNRNLKNQTEKYWQGNFNLNHIINNEQMKYDNLKFKEQSILGDINKLCYPIRLWRFKDKFYYRPSEYSEVIECDINELQEEISSRYSNVNICIVSDLNDAMTYNNIDIKVDTTYLSINSIPVVTNTVFEKNINSEIIISYDGSYSLNKLRHSAYLVNRLYNFELKDEPVSYAKQFIQQMTTIKDLKFLANRLGKFFKHLDTSNAIVLVGNKDVSEDILLNKILKPIFGSSFCITLTDKMLKSKSVEDIVKYKLIYHIDHIPEDKVLQAKLREVLLSILVNKFLEIENQFVPIYGQVIITIDEAEPFLKDFLSSSDIFFVNSMDDIMTNLEEDDKSSFHKKLYSSLDTFSKELSVLGNIPITDTIEDTTDNQKFIKMLDKIDKNIVKLIEDNILDPFSSNFENLIPMIERYKHTHVTGVTGSGKSELLKALIMADILRADGSVILLEPHGDLAQSVIKLIKDKIRLININPFLNDAMTPTLNIFYLPNKSEANIARLTQVILNVLKGVNADESFTGAMEDVLEMCIRVLLRKGGGSFQELYRFLNDNRNEDLVQFGVMSPNILESEFFEDDFVSSKPTKDAIRRRLKKLLNDPTFSNLMNGENTIDLEEAMNTVGRVIIFNIPKGKMPNTYKYYIRFIVEYIQILALKRADLAEVDRVHTHLYIDEAHNFLTSTATISETLTESRKYRLYLTLAHQAITQIRDTNLRDIIATMTNVKIIGKNSNKTLEIMNKTLNTKLEDVEKLEVGEFYLSAGNNDIIKINATDKLLDGKEDITELQEEEQKQYQLDNYYREVENLDDKVAPSEYLNQIFDNFINAIKLIDIAYFDKVQDSPKLYEELIYNFNDESDDASGYISKQDLYQYFNLIYPENSFISNKELLKLFKTKDDFFKQDVNKNKTYNSKKRLFIS